MNTKIDILYEKSKKLSVLPGVYLMKDKKGEIIYIGKAKVLRNRVSSYFSNIKKHDPKVMKMVERVEDFDFIVTETEFEALVLENSLIKQYSPKYNILLKDDKGYHYIMISNEEYPKITVQKKKEKNNSEYIGPYISSFTVSQTVDEINKIFMLPTCNRKFPKDFNKERPCLNYYIKQCRGVCKGNISSNEYKKIINEAVEYIKKGSIISIDKLKDQMLEASDNMEFEKAAKLRDRINAIKKITEKQNVVLDNIMSIDVIAFFKTNNILFINMLIFRNTRLIDKEDIILTDISNVEESVREFLTRYYSNKIDMYIPDIVLINSKFNDFDLMQEYLTKISNHNVKIIIPNKGEYKKLVDMAYNNAIEYFSYKGYNKNNIILEDLSTILNLKSIPKYIEAYDIANFGDSTIVGGMVVFENSLPNKKAYKRFMIKNVNTQDDYASMKEVLNRRFKRYFSEMNMGKGFGKKPDLILLDGGKGHVSSAIEILNTYGLDIPIFGLVKDNKHRTRAIAKNDDEISISSNKSVFNFLSNIQNEVHNYSVSYLRKKHSSNNLQMELINIKGIGHKKAEDIIKFFKTKDAILNSDVDKISKIAKISLEKAYEIKKFISKLY